MKIAVIGTGYVGLVTATCFAESGNVVVGIDRDQRKIDILESGHLPIYEPGLQELVDRNRREGRLQFTTDLQQGVAEARFIFIAVGTPQSETGSADLRNLWALVDSLAPLLTKNQIVVIKSTVPVGTNRAFTQRLAAHTRQPLEVASNPEFLKEGVAIEDFNKPDRVVVGVRSEETARALRDLYAPFLRTERPFLVMSPESAEMTKYAANAMLATKISFINEIANLCERVDADIVDVRRGIGHDARIGFQFLFPSPGYGGSCLPKDVKALIAVAHDADHSATLLRAVDQVNSAQKQVLMNKVRRHYGADLATRTLAVWGLAFKPRTDDIRDSPALALIDALLEEGVALRVYDPEAMENVRRAYGDRLIYCSRPMEALRDADGLAILTEWQEFRNPDFDEMHRLLNDPVIFDGRNLYEPRLMATHGLTYYGLGRRPCSLPEAETVPSARLHALAGTEH